MARSDPQMLIRLPQEMKDWVVREAKRNERTVNSQVVWLLRQKMEREQAAQAA